MVARDRKPRPGRCIMRLEIRSQGTGVGPGLRAATERKLHFQLARFPPRVRHVSLHLLDLDGDAGPLKSRCQIAARLSPTGRVSVVVTEVDRDTALDRAASRLGSAVARSLMR